MPLVLVMAAVAAVGGRAAEHLLLDLAHPVLRKPGLAYIIEQMGLIDARLIAVVDIPRAVAAGKIRGLFGKGVVQLLRIRFPAAQQICQSDHIVGGKPGILPTVCLTEIVSGNTDSGKLIGIQRIEILEPIAVFPLGPDEARVVVEVLPVGGTVHVVGIGVFRIPDLNLVEPHLSARSAGDLKPQPLNGFRVKRNRLIRAVVRQVGHIDLGAVAEPDDAAVYKAPGCEPVAEYDLIDRLRGIPAQLDPRVCLPRRPFYIISTPIGGKAGTPGPPVDGAARAVVFLVGPGLFRGRLHLGGLGDIDAGSAQLPRYLGDAIILIG